MKEFHYPKKVRFGHTDPAGIVFYPRYFEMINEAIEDWYEALGYSFEDMHLEKKYGVPLVHIEADFVRPSRIGEELDFCLRVIRLGRTSLSVEILVTCGGEPRFKTIAACAYVDLNSGKTVAWPEDFREALEPWLPENEKDKA